MDIDHSPRHTRRGFLRGDSAPKFFSLVPLNNSSASQADLRPPVLPAASTWMQPAAVNESAFPPPPPPHANNAVTDAAPPHAAFLAALEAATSKSSSNAFLAWLGEQLANEALRDRLLDEAEETADPGERSDFYGTFRDVDADDFNDISALTPESNRGSAVADKSRGGADQVYSLPGGKDGDICPPRNLDLPAWFANSITRVRWNPEVEVDLDGSRCESFPSGSRILKDELGRVVEVRSQFGDCLYFTYGSMGSLEHFERTDAQGHRHSEGHKDKHGVVIRDYEGRVRAAGETMVVDPRGCFYVHTFDGQYISLDLVTGIHSERRKVKDTLAGTNFVITSLFTHDGFRMATVFSGMVPAASTGPGEMACLPEPLYLQELRFRFYGRDGTLIEFASEDDLRRLQPMRVSPPAMRKVSRSWQQKRQAGTAWDSVHDYLMRVS